MTTFKHGLSGYTNHDCRCTICRLAIVSYNSLPARVKYKHEWYIKNKPRTSVKQKEYNATIKRKEYTKAYNKFYKRSPTGKIAIARYNKKRRTDPDKLRKYNARIVANKAQERGKIISRPCMYCGEITQVEKHHEDYSKPKSVEWFCRNHHIQLHKWRDG